MNRVNQRKACLLALLTVLFWSTVATAFKIALQDLNSIQLLLVANFTAFLVYSLIMLFRGKKHPLFPISRKEIAWSAFQGLLNPFAYYLVIFKAYSILPAQIAQPVNFIWPVVLMLLSAPLLKQPLRPSGLLALFISFTGVLILSSQGNIRHFRINEPAGIALALSSAFIWSFFWIFNLRDKRDDIHKLFMSSLFSLIYIFVLAISTGNLHTPGIRPVFAAAYIGLFEMGITFVIWLRALQLSESTARISNLVYLTPFISLIFIHFILKEKLYFTSVIGLFLIMGGILVQHIKKDNP
jgi:drug/metabolite transporter (DMT)-like permease